MYRWYNINEDMSTALLHEVGKRLGGEEEPTGDTVEHCYAGSKHVQNYDGSSSYGSTWHWAGASYNYNAPVKSPNADTASQDAYNLANAKTPQRRTWQSPVSAGDERNLYGQGKPMAKDSSGSGADWSTGIESESPDSVTVTLESRLDFDGTVAPTDLSRATDAREKGRIGIFGSQLSYASNGQVWSEPLGRQLNPESNQIGVIVLGPLDQNSFVMLRPNIPDSSTMEPSGSFQTNSQAGGSSCSSGGCNKHQASFSSFNPWTTWVDPGFDNNYNDRRHQWGWFFGCDWMDCPPGYTATYEPRGGFCYCRFDPSKQKESQDYYLWLISLWHRELDGFIGIDFGGNSAGWMWDLPGAGDGGGCGNGNGNGNGGGNEAPGVPDPPNTPKPDPGPCDEVSWHACGTLYEGPSGCMGINLYPAHQYCRWCNGLDGGGMTAKFMADDLFEDCGAQAWLIFESCIIPFFDANNESEGISFLNTMREILVGHMLRLVEDIAEIAFKVLSVMGTALSILSALYDSACWYHFLSDNLPCCRKQYAQGNEAYWNGFCFLRDMTTFEIWNCRPYL